MRGNDQMTIEMEKEDLLRKMRSNREKHAEGVAQAKEGYLAQVMDALQERVASVENKRPEVWESGFLDFDLHRPMDMTEQYDEVISMLEDGLGDKISLTQDQYRSYVLDKWGWKRQVAAINSVYTDAF